MGTVIIPTYKIGGEIVDLVKQSKAHTRVYLISPYLALWGTLESEIASACKRDVEVTVVFRREKRKEYQPLIDKLHALNVQVADVDNLHAKIYVNDSSCVVTSMNLYRYSESNNEEFALFTDEAALLDATTRYAQDLFASQKAETLKPKTLLSKLGAVAGKAAVVAGSATVKYVKDSFRPAYCIRCGIRVENYDKQVPFCPGHFREWQKFKNVDHAENFCHSCGQSAKTSMSKPECYTCWKKDAAVRA